MHGSIYISDSIDWSCQLNSGLRHRWQSLPDQQRGNVCRDLCQRVHGTLVNAPSWAGPLGRPGGFGALRFVAASSQRVDLGDLPSHAGAFWKSIWVRGTPSGTQVFYGPSDATWWIGFSSGAISWNGSITTAGTYNDGAWHHVIVSRDASVLTIYVDGISRASGAMGSTVTNGGVSIGSFGTVGFYFDGELDDARHADGFALGDNGAWAAYDDARRGSPLTLNWLRLAMAVGEAGAAASAFPWHYYQQMQAMAG